jgi:hypothetical protein
MLQLICPRTKEACPRFSEPAVQVFESLDGPVEFDVVGEAKQLCDPPNLCQKEVEGTEQRNAYPRKPGNPCASRI